MATKKQRYQRAWYKKNRERIKEKLYKRRKAIRQERLIFLRTYKARKGCADCNEKDPLVLDFDHKNPKKKHMNVCDMVRDGWSMINIMKEVKKCEVVCANCHRRRTAKQFEWGSIDDEKSNRG